MYKKRLISLLLLVAIIASLSCNVIASSNTTQTVLTSSDYSDKTLAGLLGHFAGFLTGYEFVWNEDGSPRSPLPDNWFSILDGPYAGNYAYAGDSEYPGYQRFWDDGIVASDDDYHIDIFNQHIIKEHGANVSYYDIKEEWKEHYVHDWGAGFKSAYLTRHMDMLPPFTGMREYGNEFYWCTEAYIENDTLGMATPGMPQKAVELAQKFSSVTGDFDGIEWAKFSAAMYAIAYTETSAYNVVTKASNSIRDDSWPKEVYNRCLALYQSGVTWREAVTTIASQKRNVAGSDNVQTLTDINNAIVILALLFGQNDYLETMKIASLAGYDGDCNAATATGIMGVLKGTAGTPDVILSRLYKNGDCTYINDTQTFFDPYIKLNYPREQSINDIVSLFQQNAEMIIAAEGGTVENGSYSIHCRPILETLCLTISNRDFESNDSSAWKTSGTVNLINSNAHSGNYCAEVRAGGMISQTVSGLEPGKSYTLTYYTRTAKNAKSFGSVTTDTQTYISTARDISDCWVRRDLIFTSDSETISLQFSAANGRAFFDNISLCESQSLRKANYEAENASLEACSVLDDVSASNGSYISTTDASSTITFNVSVPETGEYMMEIRYANGGDYLASQQLMINGTSFANIYYRKTASSTTFYNDTVCVPVEFSSGNNELVFSHNFNNIAIDQISIYKLDVATIEDPYVFMDQVTDTYNYLQNSDFSSGHESWDIWSGSDGSGETASKIETDATASNEYCLTQSSDSAFEVYTNQTVSEIPNGHYTLRAYVKSSGGQKKCFLSAKGFGAGLEQKLKVPHYGSDEWVYMEIPGILVQTNTITVGFYTLSPANTWLKVDRIELLREEENYIVNSSFESESRQTDWGVWPGRNGNDADSSYYEQGGFNSNTRLTHCKTTPYEVFTGQTVTNLENGVYTLSAWVKGAGDEKHFLSIKHYGSDELTCPIPNTDTWEQICIRNIPVTSGQCEVGIYSVANANEWCSIDSIVLEKTNEYFKPTGDKVSTNLITNSSFEYNSSPSMTGWGVWNGASGSGENASFIEESGYLSNWRLTHYKNNNYEVFNGQTIENLSPGRYTLSAWVIGDGSETHFLSVKNHGHAEQTAAIPNAPFPEWTRIEIRDIPIYTGSCEVGIYSNTIAGSWCSIDNVELILQD